MLIPAWRMMKGHRKTVTWVLVLLPTGGTVGSHRETMPMIEQRMEINQAAKQTDHIREEVGKYPKQMEENHTEEDRSLAMHIAVWQPDRMVGKEDLLVIHNVFDMVETEVDREANEENEDMTDQLIQLSLDSL
jgi:hypothetical protein